MAPPRFALDPGKAPYYKGGRQRKTRLPVRGQVHRETASMNPSSSHSDLDAFLAARDFLLRARSYEEARAGFRWPDLIHFNWALDYFDRLAAANDKPALVVIDEQGEETAVSYARLSRRSNQAAHFLSNEGVEKGTPLLLMMNNSPPLFEALLAAMKTGAVVSPASTLLTTADIKDRLVRGRIQGLIADAALADRIEAVGDRLKTVPLKILVGGRRPGWTSWDEADGYPDSFAPAFPTYSTDPCLMYFTSGTTAHPKIVVHTHASYPVGHLVTMAWIGLQPSDLHFNISAPGWGKHAWSSFFAPWNAGATVFLSQYDRFDAGRALDQIARFRVTTLCAPPTVWRRFLQEDLSGRRFALRQLVSAGEPLNQEIIARVRQATGLDIREGYGQTETVLQIGCFPGMPVQPGAMGKTAPGFEARVVGPDLRPVPDGAEGQIALRVAPERPMGLMKGYQDDRAREDDVFIGGWYLTGDVARRDADGLFWFVGRNDDVFKSSDYRISPFEIESALLPHPAVAEAAVVPCPDEARGFVPKAFIALRPGHAPSAELALDLFRFCRHALAPYKRPRRIEFMDELLKTISGKIKRAELRRYDDASRGQPGRRVEYRECDFAEALGAGRPGASAPPPQKNFKLRLAFEQQCVTVRPT